MCLIAGCLPEETGRSFLKWYGADVCAKEGEGIGSRRGEGGEAEEVSFMCLVLECQFLFTPFRELLCALWFCGEIDYDNHVSSKDMGILLTYRVVGIGA